MMIIILL